MTPEKTVFDPRLDLVLERLIEVPVERVWQAWTRPEHLVKWFTPVPWSTVSCEIDLRPGGAFGTVMRSPEGEEFPGMGCFLEVVEQRRLVWTSALRPGWRPAAQESAGADGDCRDLQMTAIISMEPEGAGTRYTATVLHPDEASRDRHEAMGFQDGWGKALDQLVEHAKSM